MRVVKIKMVKNFGIIVFVLCFCIKMLLNVNIVYRAIVNNIKLGIKFIGSVVRIFIFFYLGILGISVIYLLNIFVNSNKLI